jgi:hypothetical protein
VLAAMGLMAVLGGLLGTCGVVVGLMAAGASSDHEGGVILGAQVPEPTVQALKARNLLKPDEDLLAFHDATVRLDMSEVSLVTSSRVVHANGDKATAMQLVDVAKIAHHTEGLLGDVIELTSEDGRSMRVEIAPLNGGESYVNVLETAWQKHHPEARITRSK